MKQGKIHIDLGAIISIMVIIILFAFIGAYDLFGIGTLVEKGVDTIKSAGSGIETAINTEKCPDFILPERITILEEPATKDIISQWKDGTGIGFFPASQWRVISNSLLGSTCRLGTLGGENKNYFYCERLAYIKSGQEIDSDGNIIRNVNYNYSISLILKPEGNWTVLDEPPSLDRDMMTAEEIALFDKDPSQFYTLLTQVMKRNGIYWLKSNYFLGVDERWIQTNGEVWSDSDNIYRNYSILNPTCIRN